MNNITFYLFEAGNCGAGMTNSFRHQIVAMKKNELLASIRI